MEMECDAVNRLYRGWKVSYHSDGRHTTESSVIAATTSNQLPPALNTLLVNITV